MEYSGFENSGGHTLNFKSPVTLKCNWFFRLCFGKYEKDYFRHPRHYFKQTINFFLYGRRGMRQSSLMIESSIRLDLDWIVGFFPYAYFVLFN